MSSKPRREQSLVFGYTRHVLNEQTNTYPLDILNEIYRIYTSIILFDWDKRHQGHGITFAVENDIEYLMFNPYKFDLHNIHYGDKTNSMCLSNIVLDASKHSVVFWELQAVRDKNSNHNFLGTSFGDCFGVYIGYVTYPILESNNYSFNTWLGRNNNEFSVGAILSSPTTLSEFYCYGANKYATNGRKLTALSFKFKNEDRFGLEFDFTTKTCQLFYNGESQWTVLKDIPSKLILTASVYNAGTIWCSKLEYKKRVKC
eukprot:136809_1